MPYERLRLEIHAADDQGARPAITGPGGRVMKHLVQFSTGLSSAEVAWRLVTTHGPDDVKLITADTTIEDDDNWRFGHKVQARLGAEWIKLTDGRTPLQLGLDRKIIPSDRMPACSLWLKQVPLRAWCAANYDPADVTVYIGYDWSEPSRIRGNQQRMHPWVTRYPLADDPPKMPLDRLFRSRGIEPPRLYRYPFSHANCGGGCVRGGITQWRLLLHVNRERYLKREAEEEYSRKVLGKDIAILTDRTGGGRVPLPLRVLRERDEGPAALFDLPQDDWGACGCEMPSDGPVPDGLERPVQVERWTGSAWTPLEWPAPRARGAA